MKGIYFAFSTFYFFSSAIASVFSFETSPVLAQTSGCGSGPSWYLARVGTPIAANQFRVACEEHDKCYDTHGALKSVCDKAFHNRMLGICARDHNTILGRPLRIACNGRADAYYTGVLEYGQDSFDKAQAAANSQPSSQGGYFANGGTTYYSDGSGYCGFVSGGHYQLHRFGHDTDIPRLGNRSKSEFGAYTGPCSVPSGYFAYDNATHYSNGDGTFCSFFTGEAFGRDAANKPNEPRFGNLETNPRDFMKWAGGCPN